MALNVNESMDLNKMVKTLNWLDEERRKDKAQIARLEERIQEQERRLVQQAAHLDELQATLTAMRNTLSRIDKFEQMVSNYKKEMTFQLEQRDESRRKELAESKRLRRIEHEALKENLTRLEKEMRVLSRYDEELDIRRTEDHRLGEAVQRLEDAVADLDKRLEEPTKAVSYLEERRRADHRRLTEMEQEVPDLDRKVDNLALKIPRLEEMIQKLDPRIEQAMKEAKKYEKPLEELRISDFQREQKMNRYLDQGEQVAKELERVRAQTQGFFEQEQAVKRALSAVEKFKKRIEKRQDEMSERQRMGEERIAREWEEWQTKRAKEQKKRDVVDEQRWNQQEKVNLDLDKRIEKLPPLLHMHQQQLEALWEVHRADAATLLSAAQDVYEEFIAPIDEQMDILRSAREE